MHAAIYAGVVVRQGVFAVGSVLGTTLAGLAALGASMAFGGCSSLPDLHFDADASVLFPEGGNSEGGIDPNCKRTGPEICNDGIDNDCNGQVDCQDFACRQQGVSCQDVPAGWTAVSFSATAHPSCPAGAVTVNLKVAAGDSTATCMCSCNAVGGACTTGNYTVSSASDGACAVTPTTTTVPLNAGGCTSLNSSITLSTRAMATPPTAPTSCALLSGLNGALTDGRLCQSQGTGGGCGANQVCAGRSTMGGALASCVTMNGRNACPLEFPKRSTVGTDATDTRACSGCACAPPTPCSGGSVSLYDNSMCKTNGMFKNADGITSTCDALAPSSGFTATHFKSTPPTGGCGSPTSQGTVTGDVSFVNERTVCCK